MGSTGWTTRFSAAQSSFGNHHFIPFEKLEWNDIDFIILFGKYIEMRGYWKYLRLGMWWKPYNFSLTYVTDHVPAKKVFFKSDNEFSDSNPKW
jgi:hypothetical protein